MLARTFLLIVVLGSAVAPVALGTTWTVNCDGSADFTEIQPAIDAAVSGDCILVDDCAVPYTGPGNWDLQIVGKDITIQSTSGDPSACIIDCGDEFDQHTAFWIDANTVTNATISGFRIQDAHSSVTGAAAILVRTTTPAVAENAIEYTTRPGRSRTSRGIRNAAPDGLRGTITVDNCEIANCGITGIDFNWGQADYDARVTDCRIGHVATGIRIGPEVPSSFDGCDIEFCDGDGILVGDGNEIQMTDCRTKTCGGNGLVCFYWATGATITGSEFTDNGQWGVKIFGQHEYGDQYQLADVVATGNGAGGIRLQSGSIQATNSTVSRNLGHGVHIDADWTRILTSCDIDSNSGSGVYCEYTDTVVDRPRSRGEAEFVDCRISGNVDDGIGGSFSSLWVWADFAVRSSVIANNGGWGITLVNEQNDGALILENVTLNGNQAGGVAADFPDCIISNTLMTGNGGTIPITRSAQVETVDITCTDLWDNTGGDWIDWLAPYLADPGNFSANPYYCDATVGNYTIGDVSPCAPGHHPNGVDCGLIGAEDVACAVVFSPMIASIDDVGNDQGRQVRIVWDRALLDDPSVTEPVTAYAVYRRQDEYKTAGGATAPSPGDRRGQRVLGWDFIETVPARGDEIYQYVAPTLCDSTAAGICWSVFFISAMTSDPFVFYDSAVDSGYSIDDLVPPDPTGFAVAYGLQNQLSWDENPAPDLAWYEVFRGETPDFPATPDHLVCQIQSLDWTDADGSWQHHYKLAAVDNVGNRSNAVDPDNVTDVGEGAPPRRTTLAAAVPNPFNPATTIAYALAHTGRVRLRVYDVVGRVVRELVAGELQTAGRYEIVWNGRDDTGRHVASGTYAVRLEAGTTVDTRLVTLLK